MKKFTTYLFGIAILFSSLISGLSASAQVDPLIEKVAQK
jgi:hypothetical protein